MKSLSKKSLCVLALCATAAAAQDQYASYPQRPVQLVVSWPAGGSADAMSRAFSSAMGRILGQPFTVVNRDGGSGIVGSTAVTNATPDGYTLNFGPVTPITNASQLLKKAPFTVDSFDFICQVFENRFGIAVPKDSPIKSMQEMFDAMKAKPNAITVGHIGKGSNAHLSFETTMQGSNATYTDIPFRGEVPIFVEMMAGRLDVGVVSIGGALMGSRPVRFLAVIGDQRHEGLPGVPSLKELNLPTLLPAFNGLMAPKGLPAPVFKKLESACMEASNSEEMKKATSTVLEATKYLPGDKFLERTRNDYKNRGEVIKKLNLAQ